MKQMQVVLVLLRGLLRVMLKSFLCGLSVSLLACLVWKYGFAEASPTPQEIAYVAHDFIWVFLGAMVASLMGDLIDLSEIIWRRDPSQENTSGMARGFLLSLALWGTVVMSLAILSFLRG